MGYAMIVVGIYQSGGDVALICESPLLSEVKAGDKVRVLCRDSSFPHITKIRKVGPYTGSPQGVRPFVEKPVSLILEEVSKAIQLNDRIEFVEEAIPPFTPGLWRLNTRQESYVHEIRGKGGALVAKVPMFPQYGTYEEAMKNVNAISLLPVLYDCIKQVISLCSCEGCKQADECSGCSVASGVLNYADILRDVVAAVENLPPEHE